MSRAAGFTLLEVLSALGLAVLLYALVSFTTLQLHRTTVQAEKSAQARTRTLGAVEQLRWQLRCLYLPSSSDSSASTPGPVPSPSPAPPGSSRAALMGSLAVYGKRTEEPDREILLFRTTRPDRGSGTTEVGYRILEDRETREPYLAYRQYPWAESAGLHLPEEDPEAPWKVLCREVRGLRLEFSTDGETWQREWEQPEAPKRIRALLVPAAGEPFQAEVVPGIEAARW